MRTWLAHVATEPNGRRRFSQKPERVGTLESNKHKKRKRIVFWRNFVDEPRNVFFFFFSFYIKSNLGLLFLVLNNKKILSIFKILWLGDCDMFLFLCRDWWGDYIPNVVSWREGSFSSQSAQTRNEPNVYILYTVLWHIIFFCRCCWGKEKAMVCNGYSNSFQVFPSLTLMELFFSFLFSSFVFGKVFFFFFLLFIFVKTRRRRRTLNFKVLRRGEPATRIQVN